MSAIASGVIFAMLSGTTRTKTFEPAQNLAELVTVCNFMAAFVLSKLGG